MNGFQIGNKRLKVQRKRTGDDNIDSPGNIEMFSPAMTSYAAAPVSNFHYNQSRIPYPYSHPQKDFRNHE